MSLADAHQATLPSRSPYMTFNPTPSIFDAAEREYQKLSLLPEPRARSMARLCLGALECYRGKFSDALTLLDQGIAADRIDGMKYELPSKLLMKASVQLRLGDNENARASLAEAIASLEPSMEMMKPRLQKSQVAILAASGDLEGAARVLGELRAEWKESDSSFQTSFGYAIGALEFERGNTAAAITALKQSSDTKESFHTKRTLGRAYLENGQLAEAVEFLSGAVTRLDDSQAFAGHLAVLARYDLGRAYEQSGWTQKAIAEYERFLAIWVDAEGQIPEIEDAKARLTNLKIQS